MVKNAFNVLLSIKKTASLSYYPNGDKWGSAIIIQGITQTLESQFESKCLLSRHACSYLVTLEFKKQSQAKKIFTALPEAYDVVSRTIFLVSLFIVLFYANI